jgi:hypothetical protein
MVGWLGDRAEGGARRQQQWGGRREAYSGEQVERLGLHAGVQSLWVREEALGVLTGHGREWSEVLTGGGNGDRGGLGTHAREERRGFLWPTRGG